MLLRTWRVAASPTKWRPNSLPKTGAQSHRRSGSQITCQKHSGATLKASAALVAALARTVILIEALDHAETTHTADSAIALNRPLLAAPADGDVRSSGSARLLAEQCAVLCPDPERALALL